MAVAAFVAAILPFLKTSSITHAPVVAAVGARRGREREPCMGAGPVAVETRQAVLEVADLDRLIATLREAGWDVLGPTVRDGAVVYDRIERADELPAGWIDEQAPGHYRLRREGERRFGYTVGVTSWKRFLSPPRARLFAARREARSLELTAGPEPAPKQAFLGVRPCELAAIAIQDRVFLGGAWTDPIYRARREATLLVVVQCGRVGPTCFCAAMGAGPHASAGFDLALTEMLEEGRHWFLLEAGSARGEQILARLEAREPAATERAAAEAAAQRAVAQPGRPLETEHLATLLRRSSDHPHWSEVARRCLACGNCTQVCPTCFCTSVEDVEALGGGAVERVRRWDTCFSPDFSYIHGGCIRPSVRARYRHWLTHKLGTWREQFGTAGCVGCGRCITWCPAGIDLTEEAAALRSAARREERTHADA